MRHDFRPNKRGIIVEFAVLVLHYMFPQEERRFHGTEERRSDELKRSSSINIVTIGILSVLNIQVTLPDSNHWGPAIILPLIIELIERDSHSSSTHTAFL